MAAVMGNRVIGLAKGGVNICFVEWSGGLYVHVLLSKQLVV